MLNFTRNDTVFDYDDIPIAALKAKREVKAARKKDVLGAAMGKRGSWNVSTSTGAKFPDRANMRTLSKFDSVKQAEYNYRAEDLDWKSKDVYLPKTSKFQFDERNLLPAGTTAGPLAKPGTNCEFVASTKLAGKEQWFLSTEVAHEKEKGQGMQKLTDAAAANSSVRNAQLLGRTGYSNPIDREKQHAAAVREAKLEWKKAKQAGEEPDESLQDMIRFGRRSNSQKKETWELPIGRHGYRPPSKEDVDAVHNLP